MERSGEPAVDTAAYVPRLLRTRPADAPRSWSVAGTSVLVDLSGFTSLSEQLAARGRVGTEELIAKLTEVFTALLTASEDGGDVVKFAGDALLLAYDGPDHARRACHAADAMRATLDRIGAVRLAGARARLRMSVGVHTGDFHYLLTGTRHLNLVVHGAAMDRLLELQDTASAGEIRVSEQTAALLPPGSTDGERLVVAPATDPYELDEIVVADLASLLPACFADRPDLLGGESEHRRAAMGFAQVHLADIDRADELTRVVERACAETGVTLLDTDPARGGYRYFLTAGAPVAVEDPEGRIIRALLSVVALVAPDIGLTVRAGVTSGQVLAGSVGAPFRRTYSVMGDTTNLAARLTAKAAPGTVLVHEPVLDRARLDVAVEERLVLQLKGKAEPIPAVVVQRAGAHRERRTERAAYVGREAELEVLRAAIDGLDRGRGGTLEVVGEPGVGKSRLVAEATLGTSWPVVSVALDPYGATVPFGAARRLVRRLLDIPADATPDDAGQRLTALMDPTWAPLVAGVVGADVPMTPEVRELDPRFRTAKMAGALADLLRDGSPPTIVVLDDAHWVDPASAELLHQVFTPDLRLLVLLTRREVGSGLRGAVTVPLEPLAPDLATRLVAAAAPTALRPAEVGRLVARAAGNPLFLLELAGAGSVATLPTSVEELVAARVDALPAADRDLLRRAAVWGGRVPARLFAHLAGELPSARLGDFLDLADGEVVFRRDVYREVAYEQLTYRRRRELHRSATEVITAHEDLVGAARLPMLSLHYFASGDWAAAHRCSRDAATEATEQHAPQEAAEFCRRAILAGRRSGLTMADLRASYVQSGEALFVLGRYAEAAHAYAVARRGVTDPERATSLTYELGMVRREEGRFDAALQAARRARTLARGLEGDKGLEWSAEIDLLEAGVRYWQGRSADCLRISRRAADSAAGLPESRIRTRLLARAYALHDTAAVEIDGTSGRYGDEPLRMFEEIGDLYNLTRFAVNVGYALFYAGDWDGAVDRYRLSLEIADRIGDVSNVAVNEMNIGELLGYQGRLDEATTLLTRSLNTLIALETPLPAAHAACFLGVVRRLSGDLAGAEERLAQSGELFREAGRHDGFSLDELTTRRVELLADQGRSTEAAALGGELLARPDLAALHRMRVCTTLAGLELAGLEGVDLGPVDHRTAALELAAADPSPYDRALTLRALGSTDQQQEAAQVLAGLGCRLEQGVHEASESQFRGRDPVSE